MSSTKTIPFANHPIVPHSSINETPIVSSPILPEFRYWVVIVTGWAIQTVTA